MSPHVRSDEVVAALGRFSSWVDELSPYHRALRTPVYLEPDAPALVRAFWEQVGWSDAIGAAETLHPLRPERIFTDREALKVVQDWCSSPDVRDRWGVTAPSDVEAALRSRLPARSRVVLATPSVVMFTDETTGGDDPPVLELHEDGVVRPLWSSFVAMLIWQTCRTLGVNRETKLRDAPIPAQPGHERPFAPALDALWTLADGVWAIGPHVNQGSSDAWVNVIYKSFEHYFRYVRDLPDGEIERYTVSLTGVTRFIVGKADALDPEHPSIPDMRRFQQPGRGTAPPLFQGLVEWGGARLWIEKFQTSRSIRVFAEAEQVPALKAHFARAGARILEEVKPRVNPFALPPTAAAQAAAKKLHERARKAAEGKKR